jgi:F0F1-type ATP synthase delta subunit
VARFGPNLEFQFRVDPEILGGVVIRVGDKLIDDSVRGRIEALRQSLGVRAS